MGRPGDAETVAETKGIVESQGLRPTDFADRTQHHGVAVIQLAATNGDLLIRLPLIAGEPPCRPAPRQVEHDEPPADHFRARSSRLRTRPTTTDRSLSSTVPPEGSASAAVSINSGTPRRIYSANGEFSFHLFQLPAYRQGPPDIGRGFQGQVFVGHSRKTLFQRPHIANSCEDSVEKLLDLSQVAVQAPRKSKTVPAPAVLGLVGEDRTELPAGRLLIGPAFTRDEQVGIEDLSIETGDSATRSAPDDISAPCKRRSAPPPVRLLRHHPGSRP